MVASLAVTAASRKQSYCFDESYGRRSQAERSRVGERLGIADGVATTFSKIVREGRIESVSMVIATIATNAATLRPTKINQNSESPAFHCFIFYFTLSVFLLLQLYHSFLPRLPIQKNPH